MASTQTSEKSSSSTSSNSSVDKNPNNNSDEPMIVRYQFLYNASRRQQTETRNDFRCPWCSLHCLQLPALLKHLRLCHSRFNFSHVVRKLNNENKHSKKLNHFFCCSKCRERTRVMSELTSVLMMHTTDPIQAIHMI